MNTKRRRIAGFVAALFAVGMLMLPADGNAQEIGNGKNFGLGVAGGNYYSSLTGKYYLDQKSAIQGFLTIGYFGGYGIAADYVYEFTTLANPSPGRLFLGAGGGAGLFGGGYDYAALTINGVLELGWHFTEVPLELVVDVRPTFGFGFGPNAAYGYGARPYRAGGFGIGSVGAIRFYF